MPTSYPFKEGPTKTTGRMEGTTSYGGICSAYKDTWSSKTGIMYNILHSMVIGELLLIVLIVMLSSVTNALLTTFCFCLAVERRH